MDLHDEPPVLVEGRIRIPYRWPAGRAGGRFLALLRDEGRLTGLRCSRCRRIFVPPRARCPSCHVPCEEEIGVGPEGEVRAWTVDRRVTPPVVLALVRLDGADTGLLHLLKGVEPTKIRRGLRVRAVLAETRRGQITDLDGFRPV
jgi:uncharacterized OB-fold protein